MTKRMNAPMIPFSFASAYRQLRPSEKAFVDAYVIDLEDRADRSNQRITNVLLQAVPLETVEASRGMLERPMVQAAIIERVKDIAQATELSAHRVIKEWKAIGFSSLADYMEIGEGGYVDFNLARCTPEQLAAIKTVEVEESGGNSFERPKVRKFKITLHDKLAGLKALSDHMGLLQDNNEHWRSETARPIATTALPDTVTAEGAADMYSAMING